MKRAASEIASAPTGEQRRETSGAALARYYDLDLSTGQPDTEMYLALAAATDGPILELACGSGRLCVPLAVAGHAVVGVDRDPDMLARARSAWAAARPSRRQARGSLRLVEEDITGLALGERFGLVLLALNGLLLLPDRAAQLRVLEVMARHLDRGGRAIVDVWLPSPDDMALYDGRVMLDWVRRDDEIDEWVSKTTSAAYSSGSGRAAIDTFFDAWREGEPLRRTVRRDAIAFIGAADLVALAERAGLEPQIVAGDYDMSEFEPGSERLILACGPTGL